VSIDVVWPWKSGTRTSTRHAGACSRTARIVAVHRGDDDVFEVEVTYRAGEAHRLLAVLPDGLAVRDGTVAAVAGADVAEDHEGRGGLFPALADVRAMRFLAHAVEIPLPHERSEPHVIPTTGRAHLEPGRLATDRVRGRPVDRGWRGGKKWK